MIRNTNETELNFKQIYSQQSVFFSSVSISQLSVSTKHRKNEQEKKKQSTNIKRLYSH